VAVVGFFLFSTAFRLALGPTQPPIQWVSGAHTLGVKLMGRKLTAHLHPVPRLRLHGAVHPLLRYIFVVWCLVKHRDNFTFMIIVTVVVPCSLITSECLQNLFHFIHIHGCIILVECTDSSLVVVRQITLVTLIISSVHLNFRVLPSDLFS